MKYCVKCNREYGDDFAFCIECGSSLKTKEAPVPNTAPMPSSAPTPGPAPTPSSAPTPGPAPMPSSAPTPGPAPMPSSAPVPGPAPMPSSAPMPGPAPTPSPTSGFPSQSYSPADNNQLYTQPVQPIPGKKSGSNEGAFKGLLIAVCVLGGLLLSVGIFCLVCKFVLDESPLVVAGITEKWEDPSEEPEEPEEPEDPVDTDDPEDVVLRELELESGRVVNDSDISDARLHEQYKEPGFRNENEMYSELKNIIGTNNTYDLGTCSIGGKVRSELGLINRTDTHEEGLFDIDKGVDGEAIQRMRITTSNKSLNSKERTYYGKGIYFVENIRLDDGEMERFFYYDQIPFCYTYRSECHVYTDPDWEQYYYRGCDFKNEQSYFRRKYQ